MPSINLYHDPIDLTTSQGKKDFRVATEGMKEKYDLGEKGSREFHAKVKQACNKFCWGECFTAVPLTYDAGGAAITFANLITNPKAVTLTQVKEAGQMFWTNQIELATVDETVTDPDIIERRMHSAMACQYLWNLLTDTAKNTLELENEDFCYFCTD
jgi:hypothetical protein